MMLISGDEKPIGYFKKPDEVDKVGTKEKKNASKEGKAKKGDSKKKSGKDKEKAEQEQEDEYYSNYFDKFFIKLARGKKMRKGLENTVSTKRAITFEVFKDELELK